MRNPHRLALGGAAVVALLTGCAAQPPAPPMAAAPAPLASAAPAAAAGGGVDGLYRGPEGGTSGNSRCTRNLNAPIRVTGGMASMSTAVAGTIEGPVGADGSLSVQSGRASLTGQFADGRFTGTYGYNSCVYTLSYAKR